MVDAAVQAYGRIDVIINNARLMPQAPLERLQIDEWDRMIDVNIKGVLYGIAAALPHLKQQKAGHIINVSSVAGHKVGPGFAVYAATKYAVRALSEGLRQDILELNGESYRLKQSKARRRRAAQPSDEEAVAADPETDEIISAF
jgi:NADP-dependent 3-hydroxy acid dehydrogenase YdfG